MMVRPATGKCVLCARISLLWLAFEGVKGVGVHSLSIIAMTAMSGINPKASPDLGTSLNCSEPDLSISGASTFPDLQLY